MNCVILFGSLTNIYTWEYDKSRRKKGGRSMGKDMGRQKLIVIIAGLAAAVLIVCMFALLKDQLLKVK